MAAMDRPSTPDIAALQAALADAQARADAAEDKAARAEAEAARVVALASDAAAVIAHLKLEIAQLRRELFGQRPERKARLLDQLELQLEELEATAVEDEVTALLAAAKVGSAAALPRKRPSRQPFPEHLPRERVVMPAPATCPCCGSDKLCKLGETVTETLESVPRQWKVIQTVRETFSWPGLRDDHPAAGAVPRHPARLDRPQPAGHNLVREIRPASAAEPAGRALRPRGGSAELIDLGLSRKLRLR